MWKLIVSLAVLVTAYVSLFKTVICPNIHQELILTVGSSKLDVSAAYPFLDLNCQYLAQLNKQNIDKTIDNLDFQYKLYVRPYFSYYQQYYYPKHKLVFDAQVAKTSNYLKYSVTPKFQYAASTIGTKLWYYTEIIGLQLRRGLLYITESEFYKKHLESSVNYVTDNAFSAVTKLTENSNFKKFNEKKNFLRNEFNNLMLINLGQKKIDVDIKDILDDGYYDSGNDSDGPITIKIISTIYETQTDAVSVETRGPFEIELDDLLDSFEAKINKTVDLAFINISGEINPIINATVEAIKEEAGEIFKTILTTNYNSYKDAHLLIQQIDKDLSEIKQTNKTVETVSRQEIRDAITAIRNYTDTESERVEAIVNEKFGTLINQYLSIIQDTIDILESFMDSSFQDFSNKLSAKLSESEDQELEWATWKKFHALKSLVLDQRDYIFDQAALLKAKQFDQVSLNNDFKEWLKFLGTITFHLNFINRDNDEYLQLIRAKANVSYQAREAAVRALGDVPEDDKKEASKSSANAEKSSTSSESSQTSIVSESSTIVNASAASEDAETSSSKYVEDEDEDFEVDFSEFSDEDTD